jgi:hypothetical protein
MNLDGERGYESGKRVKGRQRPLVVDTLGLGVAVLVRAVSGSDSAGTRLLCLRFSGAWKELRVMYLAAAGKYLRLTRRPIVGTKRHR